MILTLSLQTHCAGGQQWPLERMLSLDREPAARPLHKFGDETIHGLNGAGILGEPLNRSPGAAMEAASRVNRTRSTQLASCGFNTPGALRL